MTPAQHLELLQFLCNSPKDPASLSALQKFYTLPPKDNPALQTNAETMAKWQLISRFTEALERNILLCMPVMKMGITFECAGSSFGQTTPGIIVRTNAPQHAGEFDLGHGYCATCCRFLPAANPCPCHLGRHDHCFSFCLCPIGEQQVDCLRICTDCAPLMWGHTIVQLHIFEQVLSAYSLAGTLLGQWDKHRAPMQFWRLEQDLRIKVIESLASDPATGRFATDGYAYTWPQFKAYYTDSAEHMWSLAGHRNCSLRVVHRDVILNRHNFANFLHTQDILPSAYRSRPSFCYLHEMEGMEDYIPPQFWPHEPILDSCIHDGPIRGMPCGPSGVDPVTNGNPIWTNWLQVPYAYKATLSPLTRLALDSGELASYAAADAILGEPDFVLAYRTDKGTPVNLWMAEKWPQLQLHHPLRGCPLHLANVRTRLDFILNKKGMFGPAIAPAGSSVEGRTGEIFVPPHSILARLQPARYRSSFGIWACPMGLALHEACRAAWPFQCEENTSPLERLRRSLFSLYGVTGFASMARDTTRHGHMLADGFLD